MLHRFLSQKAEEEGDGTSIRGSGIGGAKRVQVCVVIVHGRQRGRGPSGLRSGEGVVGGGVARRMGRARAKAARGETTVEAAELGVARRAVAEAP